jgi:hypothetical protein
VTCAEDPRRALLQSLAHPAARSLWTHTHGTRGGRSRSRTDVCAVTRARAPTSRGTAREKHQGPHGLPPGTRLLLLSG